ncbi:alpha-ketoacid dehydrogenase subunit alpha/beta [Runella slithyformis]|uniref:Transketolase domain-containing protein n=1 Tax=Runella slithyformis (strain ATCC 29530 / DSM 19594 / LMG 11500 / NCIMB 11436 / LSU 4) TaxID=761193 RepID=A0A7U4E6E0_RUNSL|nr:Transketolase domain-containing protein [Runella slithyformis DSM 19594]
MIENELATDFIALTRQGILNDYRLVCESRQASLLGRKDVMGGRAKFGIFGDGKELAQVAMAKVFRQGDFRSGYYRDQTIVAALGNLTWQHYFSQLYGHADVAFDPHTAGRSMNNHYTTRFLDENGLWKSQTDTYNHINDLAPTAGQVPRSVGLAYASKLYRQNEELWSMTDFSHKGNEITFSTIGDASTSQGMFWETMNAAGVLQVPLLMSVWDDGFGISVPVEYQTTKGSISKALAGLQRHEDENGIEIFTVKAWDYVGLLETYRKAEEICRRDHIPVLIHVQEVTQPQGHSSSGTHTRYKSAERLSWEREWDCNRKFKEWILTNGYANNDELEEIEEQAKKVIRLQRNEAWKAYTEAILKEQNEALALIQAAAQESRFKTELLQLVEDVQREFVPLHRYNTTAVRKSLRTLRFESIPSKQALVDWLKKNTEINHDRFSSYVYSQSPDSPLKVPAVAPEYNDKSPLVDGREVIRANFNTLFANDPRIVALGEDVGKIGDVNQGFAGLQERFGELRITDTGIRETTIIGQGIGLAIRGLKPIVEIQYFDYVFYALATLTDDLASLHYRTKGGQKAPLIVRTRGHRLEGIWHSGSPMATVIHSLRGLHVCVPRNLTQAAGMYNTLLRGDDPALLVEPLNGYRLKERMPDNLGEFCVSLGRIEVLRAGTDITIVTYGSMCRIVMEAAEELSQTGISVEVIDVQTLLPFDLDHQILASIQKTNRVIFADEDMPGGGTGYMMQQVLDEQGAYQWLDSAPRCVSAKPHRPAYSSDGDYFSKPNVEDIFEAVYALISEAAPDEYPSFC